MKGLKVVPGAPDQVKNVIPIDASARLSWELVKITSQLPIEQQLKVIEFAKSLCAPTRTNDLLPG